MICRWLFYLFSVGALSSFSCFSSAESKLDGIWVQDKSRNIYGPRTEYLKDNCLTPKLAFSDGVGVTWQMAETCSVNGKEVAAKPYFSDFEYSVLESLDDTLVVEYKPSGSRSPKKLVVYHFIDENTFWEYYYGESNEGIYHFRVYYKRLTDKKAIEEAMKEVDGI